MSESQREYEAKRQLERQGITVFLPTYFAKDKSRHVRLKLLFRGYIFFSLPDVRDWPKVKNTIGVQSVLTYRDRSGFDMPKPIDSEAIESLRELALSFDEGNQRPQLYVHAGTRVKIISGPFSGPDTAIVQWADHQRAGLLMKVFNKEVKVTFFIKDLELQSAAP